MLERLITWCLQNRFLVVLAGVVIAGVGSFSLLHLDVDAFPDTTPVQVQVNTVAPALGPEEVERQITIPLEQVFAGLPQLQLLRSISKFGLSQIVLTFRDGTDMKWARQMVAERLTMVELPEGIERPTLGPISTGLGEIFHYVVTLKNWDPANATPEERVQKLTYLRTLQDWVIKPKLLAVPGVTEVNSWGGYKKQYEVRPDPQKLLHFNVTLEDVIRALEANNQNVGAGVVRQYGESVLVQGIGRITNEEQLRQIGVISRDGVPVRIGDIAEVTVGYEIRRGAVTANGKGEAVLGLCFMLMGENSHEVCAAIRKRLEEIKAILPPDVDVHTVYDRTELVNYVLETVRKNAFEGALLVIAVLFLFLGNLRAAAIVALAIPLSMLVAFTGMLKFGIAISLLSLGAIDFGMVVDSSVVMVENCVRHVAKGDLGRGSMVDLVRQAAIEVRKPTLFGEMIIMIVYLPILALEGIEGKMFRPMALTVIFCLFGALVLSLTLMPVLASIVLPRRIQHREPLAIRLVKIIYRPFLSFSTRYPGMVLAIAIPSVVFVLAGIGPRLGSEFLPKLSEGSLTINVVRLTGTSLEDSIALNTRMEKMLLEAFPDEIREVWSRIGTAEVATDPMGIELTDIYVMLRPRSEWKKARTQDELRQKIEEVLRVIPGQRLAFSQPIELRMNELIHGVRSDLGIKIFGDDYDILLEKAAQIETILRQIPGSADVATEQVTGQPALELSVKQDEIARYGLSGDAVLRAVETLGGYKVGTVVEGDYRFPLVVAFDPSYREHPDKLSQLILKTPAGQSIPLARLVEIRRRETPATITREWGQRRVTVTCNIRGRDMGSFVAEARRRINEEVLPTLPSARYFITYGGQFENFERAFMRLAVVVPLALGLVLFLLYLTYHNIIDVLRVFTGVPFGWVGGVLALWFRDMPLSVSAVIGFIALSGIAVLDDMLLVSTIRQLRQQGLNVSQAVREAAIIRLRPVLMTTLVASLGFLPMALSTGQGAEVQRPLATVVIGGVIGAMVMSLLVLRALYLIFDGIAHAIFQLCTRVLGADPESTSRWLGLDVERSTRPFQSGELNQRGSPASDFGAPETVDARAAGDSSIDQGTGAPALGEPKS